MDGWPCISLVKCCAILDSTVYFLKIIMAYLAPPKTKTIHNLEIEFQSNYTRAKAEKIVQLRR